MKAKEKWIKEVEDSLLGLRPAEVNPYLYAKIFNRLTQQNKEPEAKKLAWLIVSTLAVVFLLNIFVLSQFSQQKVKTSSDIQLLSEQFELAHDNFINYNINE